MGRKPKIAPGSEQLSELNLDRMIRPRRMTMLEVRQADPYIGPSWRYEAVLRALKVRSNKLRRMDDVLVRTARDFLSRWQADSSGLNRDRLRMQNAGLAMAWMLWSGRDRHPETNIMLEARLLSRQPFLAIARSQCIPVEAVAWYESLFYNVRHRLSATDWIMTQILLPAAEKIGQHYNPERQEPDVEFKDRDGNMVPVRRVKDCIQPHLDFTLPYFAYFGGPIVCEFMITGFRSGRQLQTIDELTAWLDEVVTFHVKRRAAQAAQVFNVNRYTALELMGMHVKIMELAKTSAGAGGGGGEFKTVVLQLLKRFLGNLPWTTGLEAEEVFEGTVIGEYDKRHIEFGPQETMLMAGENKVPEVQGLAQLKSRMENLR